MIVGPDINYIDAYDRLVVLQYPTKTPYTRVLVYKLENLFCIVYNTKYQRKSCIPQHDACYKQFIPCGYVTKHKIFRFDLYDTTKGTFPGILVVPKEDICVPAVYGISVKIGRQGKAIVYCKNGEHLKATLYDVAESNHTAVFQLVLKNAVSVALKNRPEVLNENVYTTSVSEAPFPIHIHAYEKDTQYQHAEYSIQDYSTVLGAKVLSLRYDSWKGLLIALFFSGPRGIGLIKDKKPMNGLVESRLSARLFKEIIVSFDPHNGDIRDLNFYFNSCGSLLHKIRTRQKGYGNKKGYNYTYIDIYNVLKYEFE
jgi:hypothetical protein